MNRTILAVFLADFHSGAGSRGYRLLCRLNPPKFSAGTIERIRRTELYAYLAETYALSV